MKKIFNLLALLLLASLTQTFTGCNPDDTPPKTEDTTDNNTAVVEFFQWNDIRVESSEFEKREFEYKADDTTLAITFDKSGIPGTELRIWYANLGPVALKEGNYTHTDLPFLDDGEVAIALFGYKSGTGKFVGGPGLKWDKCRLFKADGEWVWEFENVEVADLSDAQWKGKLSGRIIWKAP